MTRDKQISLLIKVVKTHERLVKQMKEVYKATDGEIDFGAFNELPEIHLFRGIDKVADLLETEKETTRTGYEEYPIMESLDCLNTKLFQIR